MKNLKQKPILTARELEVAKLLVQGYSNPEIAQILSVTISTAKAHVSNIMEKFHAKNRAHIVFLLIKNKLIEL